MHSIDTSPDLLILTGSRLYGTSGPDSDYDYRGFYVPTKPQLFSLTDPPIINDVGGIDIKDCQVYPLKKFIQELARANAQHLELLFAPEDCVVRRSSIGSELIKHRDLFITNRVLHAVRGFAWSEKRRFQGIGLEIKFDNKTDEEVCELFFGRFQVTGYVRNQIYDIVFAERNDDPRHEVKTTKRLGEKRKEDLIAFGYDRKSATNYIRLLGEAIELATNKTLTFPRPDASWLRQIKKGEVPLAGVVERGISLEAKLEILMKTNPLPPPNLAKISDLYFKLATME